MYCDPAGSLILQKRTTLKTSVAGFCLLLLLFSSCNSAGVIENTVRIPGNNWSSSFTPSFQFSIQDTTSRYNVYIVIRHLNAYRYKNLWLELGIQVPGEAPVREQRNLILATDESGWLGKGMDDIFEHRILLNSQPATFRKKGTYTYTLKHLMREDPLEYLMNAGIRIEKAMD
jgi:gliding motility-associated lipoprotein GldH